MSTQTHVAYCAPIPTAARLALILARALIAWSLCQVTASPALASGKWGLSLGYNNPSGSNVGGNFIYLLKDFAFEFGIGSVGGRNDDKTKAASLAGNIDAKVLFGDKFKFYLEFGLAVGLGAGLGANGGAGVSAGSPFAGAGAMFDSGSLFLYGTYDYNLNAKDFYPAFGVGLHF